MKILIISQHIFPIQTPRANRTTELAKELGRLGHDVTVYAVLGKYNYTDFEKKNNVKVKNIPIKFQKTPYNSDGHVNRAFIDKVLGKLFGKLLEFPNIEFKFSIPPIIKNEPKADVLISIADPHHIHWGCARAKRLFPKNFPSTWIADCGDPFMSNVKNKYHYQFYSKYEKLFCESCDFITVPIEEAIEAYYPEFRHKIRIIPQGFSFEIPIKTYLTHKNSVPTFAYAGTFYKEIRNPSAFLNYLTTIKTDFKFIIFTRYKDLVLPYKKVLQDKLELRDPVDREQLIELLKTMDFLVNIENHNSPNQTPSKLIDYALTGRPILSINNTLFNPKIIEHFLSGEYSESWVVKNIEQYHISNVVKNMLLLVKP